MKKEVQGGQSHYIYISILFAACFVCVKGHLQAIKMHIKKDNINTIHENDTFQVAAISVLYNSSCISQTRYKSRLYIKGVLP